MKDGGTERKRGLSPASHAKGVTRRDCPRFSRRSRLHEEASKTPKTCERSGTDPVFWLVSWLRARWKRVAAVPAVGVLLLAVLILWPMDTAPYLNQNASGELVDRSGKLLRAYLNPEEQWAFAKPLKDISPRLIQATIAAEDQRFRYHPGIDPVAVLRAAWQNARDGRVVSGASTLTMQVVKRGGPPSRSLPGKLWQAAQALRLDARVSKDRILEAYLNTAPYGLNLVGCEAAARRYFGKPARELTLVEAATLAGLPKSPTGFMPLAHPRRAQARRDYVLRRMRREGYISEAEYQEARKTPLGTQWNAFPMASPHLAMRLREEVSEQGVLSTTLDAAVQARCEALVREHLRYYPGEISNAAVVVIDVESASTLARVGSGDFFATPGGGQVDACRALRSPGSALKPFMYALAMDQQRLYACESLYDGALDYGRYNPENFDSRYRGLISASDALRMSLNVPAVSVLDRIGVDAFHSFLPRAGITTATKAPEHYGLGLTLGNCEVRLEDVAAAYCMIARLGEYQPIRSSALDPEAKPVRCLSRGACLELFAMLEQTLPGDFDASLVPIGSTPSRRVCWKTGTSTGYHDAWTFMFNRHYVVGVWMGNNNGATSKWLVGATVALPLATRVFRALPAKSGSPWPEAGNDLHAVRVCAVSGLPATPWCTHSKHERLPRAQYLHRRCDMHHPAPGESETERGVIERWPGATKGWDLAKIAVPRIPVRKAAPEPTRRREALRILNPTDKAVFVLTGEESGDRIKLAASLGETEKLHWYLDDHYLGKSAPGASLFLDLRPGAHHLTCMSASGVINRVSFVVAAPEKGVAFGEAT